MDPTFVEPWWECSSVTLWQCQRVTTWQWPPVTVSFYPVAVAVKTVSRPQLQCTTVHCTTVHYTNVHYTTVHYNPLRTSVTVTESLAAKVSHPGPALRWSHVWKFMICIAMKLCNQTNIEYFFILGQFMPYNVSYTSCLCASHKPTLVLLLLLG